MNNTFITSAAALDSQMRVQESIAFNVANVNTPGFKRRVSATENAKGSFRAHFEKARSPLALPRVRGAVDFTQGDIRQTGNPLDVALRGKGFLKIETADGPRYTRNGSLAIDQEGRIITQGGDKVALRDAGGGVSPNGGSIVITEDGTILQGTDSPVKIGRLEVVDFPDPKLLVAENGTVFRAPEGVEETAGDATVHQGALEGSNVNAVTEFVAMISVERNFESVTRLLRNVDDVVKRSLER